MEVKNESKSIRKTDLRKVQSNQEKGCYQSYLREPETQTETGLILVVPFRRHQYRSCERCLEIIERKAIRVEYGSAAAAV